MEAFPFFRSYFDPPLFSDDEDEDKSEKSEESEKDEKDENYFHERCKLEIGYISFSSDLDREDLKNRFKYWLMSYSPIDYKKCNQQKYLQWLHDHFGIKDDMFETFKTEIKEFLQKWDGKRLISYHQYDDEYNETGTIAILFAPENMRQWLIAACIQ